jgi:hypothetical protein
MRKILSLLISLLLTNTICFAQEPYREIYTTWEEFLEYYADEIDTQSEDLEILSQLKENPLNLNTATKEELQQLTFLSSAQVDSLLAYRCMKRKFITMGELQFISGWDNVSRRHTSLFTYIGDTLVSLNPFSKKIWCGNHLIESRLDIPTYKRKGELQDTKGYLGNGMKNVTRYRYTYKNQIAYGVTFEKDAGEPFADQGNNPFDYNSFYFKYSSNNQKHKYIVGDFTLHFGEGLVIGKNVFGGQLGILKWPSSSHVRLNEHTGTDEHNFFRGLAYSFNHRNLRITSFASHRLIDANIENNKAVTLYTNGVHRTLTELKHKNKLQNTTLGVFAERSTKHANLGLGGYYNFYDKEIAPIQRHYNKYALHGKHTAGASLSYSIHGYKRICFSGELAVDHRLHLAFSNRVSYKASDYLQLFSQMRWFSKRFVSPFAKTINMGSKVCNEQGLLLGCKSDLGKNTNLESYIDVHRFPFATYRSNKTSHGIKFYCNITKTHAKGSLSSIRYTYRGWQENATKNKLLLSYEGKHRLRLQHSQYYKRTHVTATVESALTHSQESKNQYGIVLSLRGAYVFSDKLTSSISSAVFSTDSYAASVYAYDALLPGMYDFGALYYKGVRFSSQIKYEWKNKLTLGLRYGATHYFNRSSISSDLQLINSATKGDFNVYVCMKL